MMDVLEMLKYSVYLDKLPQEASRRVSLAIKYLELKGIQSCEGYMPRYRRNRVTLSLAPFSTKSHNFTYWTA